MTDRSPHGMIFLIQDVIHQTKSAMTYMNKFAICENDQFDILNIAYHGLTEQEVELSIESSITEVGVRVIVSKLFLSRKRIISRHHAGRPTSDHCT